MEGNENKEGQGKNVRDEIYAVPVRAGRRTYFFDVKETRKGDLYLTITESKKRFKPDGKHFYEKHRLFLYKEDFDKFADAFKETVDYINENQPPHIAEEMEKREEAAKKKQEEKQEEEPDKSGEDFTNVDFEDLDKNKED